MFLTLFTLAQVIFIFGKLMTSNVSPVATKSMLGAIIFVQQALEAGKRIFEGFGWHATHFRKGTET